MKLKADDIRRIRKVYKLTLQNMAALCDCSTSLMSKIERGDRVLTDSVALKLIDELQLTVEKVERINDIYETYRID
ncbi:helix-turn-helix domain-containing protein [Rossellomorea aquimaris]|uniref:helix-turn-helix domain-containing protein n=1 Tax=Rossellomorea aquimaris TaxID=189382 RepID=UPI001CFE1038|nr:helix-turn-helix transcriptional regulator [Rossellomorea aquimaris]